MPTFDLRVQELGTLQDIVSIVGASEAHKAVDDSAGTSHDGDATYMVVGGPAPTGGPLVGYPTVSFFLGLMAEGLTPTSLTVNAAVKGDGVGGPAGQIIIGDGTTFCELGARVSPDHVNYSLMSETIAWSAIPSLPFLNGVVPMSDSLHRLQVGVGTPGGENLRVTLISATIDANGRGGYIDDGADRQGQVVA